MTGLLIAALVATHFALCGVALGAAFRIGAYSRTQLLAQSAFVLLVPLLGALAVIFFARERSAAAPSFDVSRFDRDDLPPHG